MGFLNIGEKDQDGKQKRIEHRGKHVRVSRTGGVSLRKQAKIAGVTVTVNSKHGFRVSKRIAKNTRIAMQNGRFVFQGRYGSGATRLNVSKTGATVSTRNALGAFNWVKPKRSSVKIAGIQVRGQNAAAIQLVYMLWLAVSRGFQFVVQLVRGVLGFIVSIPVRFSRLKQQRSHAEFARYLDQARTLFQPSINDWHQSELVAGVLLVLAGWGAGLRAEAAAQKIIVYLEQQSDELFLLRSTVSALPVIAEQLEQARARDMDQMAGDPRVIMALFAQQAAEKLSAEDTVEALYSADELALELGVRTVFQDELVQVFTEFAGLQFATLPTDESQKYAANPSVSDFAGQSELIDLNTATLEQLQTLPHIGAERAEAIIALRPIIDLTQLQSINGIGPARLAAIAEHCLAI